VLGYEGIIGNGTANELTKLGPECPFIKPEAACSISVGVAKEAARDWTKRETIKNTGNP
jgi:hypothetical protein